VPAHLRGRNDALVAVRPVLSVVSRFAELLDMSAAERTALAGFESLVANSRPLGDAAFLAFAEEKLGRSLGKGKPKPKPRSTLWPPVHAGGVFIWATGWRAFRANTRAPKTRLSQARSVLEPSSPPSRLTPAAIFVHFGVSTDLGGEATGITGPFDALMKMRPATKAAVARTAVKRNHAFGLNQFNGLPGR
jgi:hypothetical protein